MSYKAIYSYAWDLAEASVGSAIDEFLALGLDTVTIAGSYHAGKVPAAAWQVWQGLFPRGRHRLFPHRRYALWRHQAAAEQPCSPMRDVLRELTADGRMAINVWLVLLHNTALGTTITPIVRPQRLR